MGWPAILPHGFGDAGGGGSALALGWGRRGARQGGIVEQEGTVEVSNVMLVDPSDNKPSRIRIEERDGARVRVFVRSGNVVPDPVDA